MKSSYVIFIILIIVVIIALVIANREAIFSNFGIPVAINNIEYSNADDYDYNMASNDEPDYTHNDENAENDNNQEDEILDFTPISSASTYSVLNLDPESVNDKFTMVPAEIPIMPSRHNNMYKITTKSRLTVEGDPIRGDLRVIPRNSDMYAPQNGMGDLRRGINSSIL